MSLAAPAIVTPGIVTPGIVAASALAKGPPPAWLAEWGRFAAALRFEDLPGEVVDRASLVLLDSIGAIAAGMQERETATLARRLAEDGSGLVPVIGAGLRLPGRTAALLNGIAGTWLELDEGNQYARGHPGIHVVPAALAASLIRGRDGRALLAALALGYEIGARIGIASKLRVTMHPHGTWGVVGAALAAAWLGHADDDALVTTINVASSLGLATSRRTMLEGGTVRNAYAGVANELGLLAWEMTRAGLTGERDGVATVYDTVAAEGFAPEAMTEALGRRWEIARNYFKRHAACRYTHGALDALAAILARTGTLRPDDVRSIDVATYVWAAQLDDPAPGNMLAAKFSLPFALATALCHGGASVAAFRDPARGEATILALAKRVSVREDPALTARLPGLRPARVVLTLADGRRFEHEVLTNRGDTEDPYGAEEVRAKFMELAAPVWGAATAAAIRDAVGDLPRAPGLGPLADLLATVPEAGR